MEADYTLSRLSDVVVDTSVRRFDFGGLCDLHYTIFQDVYEWAGKPRVINIEKSEAVLGELSVEYSECFDIERDAVRILSEMNRIDWKAEPFDALAAANAVFSDIGDLRKPEYLYRIVEDALEQGREMKERIRKQLREAGISATEKRIREVVLWNCRTEREHTTEELRTYWKNQRAKTR